MKPSNIALIVGTTLFAVFVSGAIVSFGLELLNEPDDTAVGLGVGILISQTVLWVYIGSRAYEVITETIAERNKKDDSRIHSDTSV
jgi:hypothetical protein